MSRFYIFDPPEAMDRPLCSSFGWTMWIARTEPDKPDRDIRPAERQGSEYQDFKIVKGE
jgi:hypothetical protein